MSSRPIDCTVKGVKRPQKIKIVNYQQKRINQMKITINHPENYYYQGNNGVYYLCLCPAYRITEHFYNAWIVHHPKDDNVLFETSKQVISKEEGMEYLLDKYLSN